MAVKRAETCRRKLFKLTIKVVLDYIYYYFIYKHYPRSFFAVLMPRVTYSIFSNG